MPAVPGAIAPAAASSVYKLFPQLDALQDALVGKLSGGERRMVSIGRALMSDARLYLIDEPTLGLAPKVSRRVIEALANIPLEGKAMVIAEQNVALLSGVVGPHDRDACGPAARRSRPCGTCMMDAVIARLCALSRGDLQPDGDRHLAAVVERRHGQHGAWRDLRDRGLCGLCRLRLDGAAGQGLEHRAAQARWRLPSWSCWSAWPPARCSASSSTWSPSCRSTTSRTSRCAA